MSLLQGWGSVTRMSLSNASVTSTKLFQKGKISVASAVTPPELVPGLLVASPVYPQRLPPPYLLIRYIMFWGSIVSQKANALDG